MEWLGDFLAFTSAWAARDAAGRRVWGARGAPVQTEASVVSPPGPRFARGKNATCDTHSFVLLS